MRPLFLRNTTLNVGSGQGRHQIRRGSRCLQTLYRLIRIEISQQTAPPETALSSIILARLVLSKLLKTDKALETSIL